MGHTGRNEALESIHHVTQWQGIKEQMEQEQPLQTAFDQTECKKLNDFGPSSWCFKGQLH